MLIIQYFGEIQANIIFINYCEKNDLNFNHYIMASVTCRVLVKKIDVEEKSLFSTTTMILVYL